MALHRPCTVCGDVSDLFGSDLCCDCRVESANSARLGQIEPMTETL
jgi:NMD protein affecting ribosome stability and mRNA decay